MNLQLKQQRYARWLYTRFNNLYFSGKLPKVKVVVEPGKLRCNSWGETWWEGEKPVLIKIAAAHWGLDAKLTFLKATILHEQVHVKLGSEVEHDSAEWKKEIERLSSLGALIETI